MPVMILPEKTTEMSFKDKWIAEMAEDICLTYPDAVYEEAVEYASLKYKEHFKDSPCILYNNYEKIRKDTTISKMIDFLNARKPITTESGSLFMQHDECRNPNTEVISKELGKRKEKKGEKFKYMMLAESEPDLTKKAEYLERMRKADLVQSRIKVIVNSEYGVSGLRSSWFFNMACATATTARGKALISTAMNAFEDFLADNVSFDNTDECIRFIRNILSERPIRQENDAKWIKNKSREEVLKRLLSKFLSIDTADIKLVQSMINGLNQEDLNRIYYKSNMSEFFLNSRRASSIITNIALSNEEFLLPMKPPKVFADALNELRDAVLEYVHYNYPTINRTYRLRTRTRKAVITIDTDSNFLNMGRWVDFMEDKILPKQVVEIKSRKITNGLYKIGSTVDYNHSEEHEKNQQRVFREVHSMIYITTEMIQRTLIEFMVRCNLKDMSMNYANMKNEFFYDTILLLPVKKHYQGMVRIQEGNLHKDPEADVKGMDYKKPSQAGEETRKFISDLVEKDILMAKGMNPDVGKLIKKTRAFERRIRASILAGEHKYVKTANIKTDDGYKNAYSIGAFKAAFLWNHLFPDKRIELPGIAYILKMKINRLKDIQELSVSHPDVYKKFEELFDMEIPGAKGDDKIHKLGDSGFTSIAVPIDGKLPDYLQPYINFDEITENNTKLMIGILGSLGIQTEYKSRGSQFISSVVQL